MNFFLVIEFWVYLGVRTCELFLCLVAIVRVRVYYVDFLRVYYVDFLCFTSLVTSNTDAEPKGGWHFDSFLQVII